MLPKNIDVRRFWPGAQAAPPPPPPPPPAPPVLTPVRRWLRWAVPALAFLLGIGVSSATSGPDVTSSPQYVELQNRLESTEAQAGQLVDEVEDARAQIRQATADAEAQIAQQAAKLQQRQVALDEKAKDLATRETALRSAEQAAVEEPASAPAPAPAPVVVPEPAAEPPSSTYYENCDAVRAAGAAPIRTGDAGYGTHLDRDRDGVACE